jgi:hypothetical protein
MRTLLMIFSITVLIVPVLVGCTGLTTLLRSQSHASNEARYKSCRTHMGYIVDESSRDLLSFNQQLKRSLSQLGYTAVESSCFPSNTSLGGGSHVQRSPLGQPEQPSFIKVSSVVSML